jgi:hypothetical protein
MERNMKRTISFKDMKQLRPKVRRCGDCGLAFLQPTRCYYGSGTREEPITIDEEITEMLFQLTTVAMSPPTVGPTSVQLWVARNPDESLSEPVVMVETPNHLGDSGIERYDADF